MTKNARWLIFALLAASAAAGLGVHGLRGHEQSVAAAKPREHSTVARPRLTARVDDPKSPEFHRWLLDLKEAELREDEMLDLLETNLSPAQKNAMLDAHLRKFSKDGVFPAPERWSKRLSEAVLRTELDLDLGQKTGRILGHLGSPAQLAELESEYRHRGATLQTGNKLAIVEASHNPEFVDSVLNDATEPLEVRESAVERGAELGNVRSLEKIVAPGSTADKALKVASVGALAERAQDTQELTKAVDLARAEEGRDSFGRSALNVAQARASESGVDGKSLVLFAEWKAALSALKGALPPEAVLLQALVTGKAFSRALWTEANPATATQLIDGALAPAIVTALADASSTGQTALLQAVAEFATDFCQECSIRGADACAAPDDRRMTYAAELAALVRPKIADGSLAFYAQHL